MPILINLQADDLDAYLPSAIYYRGRYCKTKREIADHFLPIFIQKCLSASSAYDLMLATLYDCNTLKIVAAQTSHTTKLDTYQRKIAIGAIKGGLFTVEVTETSYQYNNIGIGDIYYLTGFEIDKGKLYEQYYSVLAAPQFHTVQQRNLQYVTGQGDLNFLPVYLLKITEQEKKNNRKPEYGEIQNTQNTEIAYTIGIPYDALGNFDINAPQRLEVVQEVLASPFVYLHTGGEALNAIKRISITTTTTELLTNKQQPLLQIAAVEIT